MKNKKIVLLIIIAIFLHLINYTSNYLIDNFIEKCFSIFSLLVFAISALIMIYLWKKDISLSLLWIILLSPTQYFTKIWVAKVGLGEFITLILLILILIYEYFNKFSLIKKILKEKYFKLLLIYGIYIIINMILHLTKYSLKDGFQYLVYFLGIPLIGCYIFFREKDKHLLINDCYKTLVISGTMISIFLILELIVWYITRGNIYSIKEILLSFSPYKSQKIRLLFMPQIVYFHKNTIGGFLGIVFPLITLRMFLLHNKINWKNLITNFLLILICGIALIITSSRASWLATVNGIYFSLIFFLLLTKGKLKKLLAGIFLILFILQFISIMSKFKRIVDMKLYDDESVYGRYLLWETGINMWKDNFITGVGIGNYILYQRKYAPKGAWLQDTPHNLYILILCEQGIIGILIVITAFLFPLIFQPSINTFLIYRLAFIAGIISFYIENVFTPLLLRGVAIPFFVILILLERTNIYAKEN